MKHFHVTKFNSFIRIKLTFKLFGILIVLYVCKKKKKDSNQICPAEGTVPAKKVEHDQNSNGA